MNLSAWDDGASVLLIEVGGHRILVDTWIHDAYASVSPAFFRAVRVRSALAAERLPRIDLILVTSVQEDHCHTPTLALLDKRIPVIAEARAARKMRGAGFTHVDTLGPGETRTLFGGQASLLGLPGYEHGLSFALREEPGGHRLCVAPHGLVLQTLRRQWRHYFQASWAVAAGEPAVHTLCLGTRPTFLKLWGLPSWLLPDQGTLIPLPEENAALLELLRPRRVILIHGTPTEEQGWAVRHFVHYPLGPDPERRMLEYLRARGTGIEVLPSPAPGVSVTA